MSESGEALRFEVVEEYTLEKIRDGRVYEVVEIDATGQATVKSVDYPAEDA